MEETKSPTAGSSGDMADNELTSTLLSAISQLEVSGKLQPSESKKTLSWVGEFCFRKGNEVFCIVDRPFIEDEFNLKGLYKYVPHIKTALCTILDLPLPISKDEAYKYQTKEQIRRNSILLYGLIHARYIQTPKGLKKILGKFKRGVYGTCPRGRCERQPVLPMGETNVPNQRCVKLYCPRCQEVYHPQTKSFEIIDGAFFGTSFPHIFIINNPEVRPAQKQEYVPIVMGFKMHKSATSRPPKVRYNVEKNRYESVPRPIAEFSTDETKMKEKMTSRGPFISSSRKTMQMYQVSN